LIGEHAEAGGKEGLFDSLTHVVHDTTSTRATRAAGPAGPPVAEPQTTTAAPGTPAAGSPPAGRRRRPQVRTRPRGADTGTPCRPPPSPNAHAHLMRQREEPSIMESLPVRRVGCSPWLGRAALLAPQLTRLPEVALVELRDQYTHRRDEVEPRQPVPLQFRLVRLVPVVIAGGRVEPGADPERTRATTLRELHPAVPPGAPPPQPAAQ